MFWSNVCQVISMFRQVICMSELVKSMSDLDSISWKRPSWFLNASRMIPDCFLGKFCERRVICVFFVKKVEIQFFRNLEKRRVP